MKTFIAMAFGEIFREKDLKIPINYSLSYDEVVGVLGVLLLIEDMKERVILPAAPIVGKPWSM